MSKPLRAAVCVFAGVAIMVISAVIDFRASQGPWRDGFAFIGPAPDLPNLVPFVEYRPPAADFQFKSWSPLKILFIDFSESDWKSILAEGEIPKPGEGEALAGVLCRPEKIVVNGETYRVTGRVRRDAAGFSTAYLIPHDAAVIESLAKKDGTAGLADARTRTGFYDRDARRRMSEPDFEWPEDVGPLFVHDAVPMPPGVPFLVLAGLALTLYGAAVLQWRLVLWLHRVSGAFDGLVAACREHARLFRFVHMLNYSVFLYVMLAGILAPQANLAASEWVFKAFSEGSLKELGKAYIDGNVPLAAWETFRNNFIVQTFLMSTLPSLLVPLFGVGKTLLSLAVVGFAMAPVWSGGAEPMTFHWLTIALELEAYILVSFGICVYTARAWKAIVVGLREPDEEVPSARTEFRFGFEALASATMYACLALAIAAIYEAVTLIALGASIAG